MKTLNIILVVLGINLNLAFGATIDSDSSSLNRESALTGDPRELSPVTPLEATFEETTPMLSLYDFVSKIAPETPDFADFTDAIPEPVINPADLAPTLPAEADFEDFSYSIETLSSLDLIPAVPAAADFEDVI